MSVTLPNGLILPNNSPGIEGDFAATEKKVADEQTKLNEDTKDLDALYAQSSTLDSTSGQKVAQAYDTYKQDASAFANDHAYLMQIAEQDAQNGKGTGDVTDTLRYGEGTRVTDNNIAQYARLFEQNRGLDQALGTSSASVQNIHNDVNSIVASANEVGLHDVTIGPNKGDGNTPSAISSPFTPAG